MTKSNDNEKPTLNTFSNHAPKSEWIDQFLVQDDYLADLGPEQKPRFNRFLSDAGLVVKVDKNNYTRTRFARLGQRLVKKEKETFFALLMINLVANNPQIRWYVRTLKIGQVYTRKDLEDTLRNEGQSKDNINSIIGALKNRFATNQFGTVIKWIDCWKKDKEDFFVRSRCVGYNHLVTLYGLYKFAEQCGDYKGFTLSTLLDDKIEREGISPSEIFGLTRDELIPCLLGLSTNYPEFIHATFTHDLEKISLAEDKTSKDVLELFKPN